MIYLLAGILIGVLFAGWYGFERQRAAYDGQIALLIADREYARNEAKLFRGLLLPAINRAEANLGDVNGAVAGHSGVNRRRIPFKTFFNQARKAANTPQIKTDALAAAIAVVQKVQKESSAQEKVNV